MATLPGDIPVDEWALTRLLVTSSRLVEHEISTQLRPLGLTHAGFGILALLQGGAMSQREIAVATRVEEQTISRTVDRLERLGMVERTRDPGDRRRFLVATTAGGNRVFREATQHDLASDLLTGLPEADALRTALIALIRGLGGEDFVSLEEPPAAPAARNSRARPRSTH